MVADLSRRPDHVDSATRRQPRTWAGRSRLETRHDPDVLFAITAGVTAGVVLAPLAVAVGVVGSNAARMFRIRWQVLAAIAVATLMWPLLLGAGAFERYAGVYRNLWRILAPYVPLVSHPQAAPVGHQLASQWAVWLGALVPLSLPVGLAAATVRLVLIERRAPTWRNDMSVGRRGGASRLRRFRHRRELELPQRNTDGVALGLTGRGDVVRFSDIAANRHILCLGASGAGKSNTLLQIAAQVIPRGLPWISVDLKGDPVFAQALDALAAASGRPFFHWTLDGGCHWDFLARGNPTERKDKVIAMQEYSPNGVHYRTTGQVQILTLFEVLARRPIGAAEPTLADVVACLTDLDRYEKLVRYLPKEHREFREQVLAELKGRWPADVESAWVGIGNRLKLLARSAAGTYLQPAPDGRGTLDLLEAIHAGAVVCFTLDSSRYPELAAQVGAAILVDLTTIAGHRTGRERGYVYVAIDEFGPLRGEHVHPLVSRARAARFCLVLGMQELADLRKVNRELEDQVFGSTAIKIVHRQENPKSCERLAESCGHVEDWEETVQVAHTSEGPLQHATGAATGLGSVRRVERLRIHPDVFTDLAVGEAIVIAKVPALEIARCKVHQRLHEDDHR